MRVLFAGTPEIAVPSLRLLHSQGYVSAVLTSPDAPRGRRRTPVPSPVKAAALELGLPVLTPRRLEGEARSEIARFSPDLLAVVAFGKIFGPRFLGLFPKGGINLHPSLLPLHRGPAPLPATILGGDERWGLTVQQLALEMDAGDILVQESFPCDGTETTASLTETAAEKGADAVLAAVRAIEEGNERPEPQNHAAATYSGLISKEDGLIDWSKSSTEIERMVRAYNPWPGAYSFLEGKKLSIWDAVPVPEEGGTETECGKIAGVDTAKGILVQTGSGLLALRSLQLQGKKRLPWQSFVNGVRGIEGSILGGTDEKFLT